MQQGQGGPPQPGYNPHAVGAAPAGQPNPQNRLLGIINDYQYTGTALNNLAVGKGNIPISIATQKPRGFIDMFEQHLGIRTKVKFVGFEEIQAQATGPDGRPLDVAAGVGLEDDEYEQFRQGIQGSKHTAKMLHNQMPLPTEFISPMNINPQRIKKIYGENADSGGGGGGGDYSAQAVEPARVILQNGAYHMGHMPESALTGVGSIKPPATPGMAREREGMEVG